MTLAIGITNTITLSAGQWLTESLLTTARDQSVTIVNKGASPVYYATGAAAPGSLEQAEGSIPPGTALAGIVAYDKLHLYGAGIALVTAEDESLNYGPFPHALLTGTRNGTRRLRVDAAQTGFWEGREFRSFWEFSIPSGATQTLRFSSPVNFVLFEQALLVDSGSIRLAVRSGSTSTGAYDTSVPIIGKNRMTSRPKPYYANQATFMTGATASFSGGDVVDVARLVASQATSGQQSVGGSDKDERGLPAGAYHLSFTNFGNSTATGLYKLFWEERP